MPKQPTITEVELTSFAFPVQDMAVHPDAYDMHYEPGHTQQVGKFAVRILTDAGVTGEYVGNWMASPMALAQCEFLAPYLLGKPALERERFYTDMKRILRHYDQCGVGFLDIALWDLAGKLHESSVAQMLGAYRWRLPAYASTYHGDRHAGGLSSPEAFADFAEQCLAMGYPAFKLHGWSDGDVAEEVALVRAVGERVGGRMDLMTDPACHVRTFGDLVKLGRACDAQSFLWLEDPLRDGSISIQAHRRLRQLIRTPLLITEHVRGLEAHGDFMEGQGTDFLRIDPELDGGITGGLKIAHAAEAAGMDAEIHACGPAHRALMAAVRNSNYYEVALVHPRCANAVPPVYADGYSDALDCIDGAGTVPVPEGPGLGVTYDWGAIERYATGKRQFRA